MNALFFDSDRPVRAESDHWTAVRGKPVEVCRVRSGQFLDEFANIALNYDRRRVPQLRANVT